MHADATEPARALECPRCGYGIGAGLSAARTRGDAHVICPECGLDSELRLIEEGAHCPRWFIEAPSSERSRIRRFLSTFVRTFLPWRFWRAVRMETQVSRRGIVAYLVGIAALIHACVALSAVISILPETGAFPRARFARDPEFLVPDIALATVFPYCPALGGDLLLAAAQGSPDRALDLGTLGRFLDGVARMTFTQLPITFPTTDAGPDATGPYAGDNRPPFNGPPNRTYPSAALVNSNRVAAILAAAASFPLAAVLLLLLLPATFRKARVRRTHLLRAGVYSLGIVPVVLFLLSLGVANVVFTMDPLFRRSPSADFALRVLAGVLACGIPLFSLLWLHAVCKHYLRLPHALGIALLLNLILILGIFAASDWLGW